MLAFMRLGCAFLALALLASLASAQPDAPARLPQIFITGDSTAANGSDGARGWSRHLARFFDPAVVGVENLARGGRSSRTFVTEGLWEDLRSRLEPGDVVLIQFGHNDNGSRGALPGIGEETETRVADDGTVETVASFGAYLREFVSEIRSRGATPVILSLISRKIWQDGRIIRSDDGHAAWARQVAAEEQVAFVDLYERIAGRYDAMGAAAVDAMFADEAVHTSYAGAVLNAESVVEGLQEIESLEAFLDGALKP